MRVDLPAPFSPSRQWISPGSTVRLMWSLATRAPNVFVMPRSSSFMRFDSSRSKGVTIEPAGRTFLELQSPPDRRSIGRERYYLLKLDGESTLIDPSMIPALILATSAARPGSTFEAKSWKDEIPTPSFLRVPTYWVLSKVFDFAAATIDASVGAARFFRIDTSMSEP